MSHLFTATISVTRDAVNTAGEGAGSRQDRRSASLSAASHARRQRYTAGFAAQPDCYPGRLAFRPHGAGSRQSTRPRGAGGRALFSGFAGRAGRSGSGGTALDDTQPATSLGQIQCPPKLWIRSSSHGCDASGAGRWPGTGSLVLPHAPQRCLPAHSGLA